MDITGMELTHLKNCLNKAHRQVNETLDAMENAAPNIHAKLMAMPADARAKLLCPQIVDLEEELALRPVEEAEIPEPQVEDAESITVTKTELADLLKTAITKAMEETKARCEEQGKEALRSGTDLEDLAGEVLDSGDPKLIDMAARVLDGLLFAFEEDKPASDA